MKVDSIEEENPDGAGPKQGRGFRAARLDKCPPLFFSALSDRIARLRQEGKTIICLDIGSPDLPPPPFIVSALSRSALIAGSHGYQTHLGPGSLREAWAEMYRRVHGVNLDPNLEIVPLLGSKEGIFHLSQAVLDPEDIALIPDPGYSTYAAGTVMAGGIPYFFPLRPESAFLPDLKSIPARVLRRAKMLWLNYPNNPTGAVAPRGFLAEAVVFARRHDLLLVHDAAYAQVCFDGYRAPSLFEIPGAAEIAVEFNSLSKSHNMAGWRVGAVVGNRNVLAALVRLKTNADSGHFRPILEAAVAALTGDQNWIPDRNEIYRRRRDLLVDGLRGMGLPVEKPRASLYVWSPVPSGAASADGDPGPALIRKPHRGRRSAGLCPGGNFRHESSSLDWASRLLDRAGVSVTPGIIFGPHGEGFIRLSLSATEEEIREALRRIERFLAGRADPCVES